jgi:hypothetical protein
VPAESSKVDETLIFFHNLSNWEVMRDELAMLREGNVPLMRTLAGIRMESYG